MLLNFNLSEKRSFSDKLKFKIQRHFAIVPKDLSWLLRRAANEVCDQPDVPLGTAFDEVKSAELHLLNSIISIPLKIEIMEFNKGKIGKPLNLLIAPKDLSDTMLRLFL